MTQTAQKIIDVAEESSGPKPPSRRRTKTAGTAVQAVPAQSTAVAAPAQAQLPADPLHRMLDIVEAGLRDPSVDVAKIEQLFNLAERMRTQQAERAYNAAMSEVQKEITPVVRKADNKQTNSKYATYDALDAMVRPIYSKHDFNITFNTEPGAAKEGEIRMVAFVTACGFTRKYEMDMPADGKGAKGGDVMTKTHAAGSAVSYGRRYLLIMIFNIPVRDKTDDDGNAAGASDCITEEQSDALTKRMGEVEANAEAFCKYFRIPAVVALPAKRFDEAMRMLSEKAKRAI